MRRATFDDHGRMRGAPVVATFAGIVLLGGAAHAAPHTVDQCLDASERGQRLEGEGKLSSAREQFALCTSPACPAPVRVSCTRAAEQVVERMPSLVIVVREEGDLDVRDAVATFDGTRREPIDGRPIALDPGPHVLRITSPGREPVERTVLVNVGEKDRVVRIQVPAPTKVASPAVTVAPVSLPTDSPTSSGGGPPVASWALLGGAAALGITGAVLAVLAKGEHDDLSSTCGAPVARCTSDETRAGRTLALGADVAFGVAIVAAAAGIVTWIVLPSSRSTQTAASPGTVRF